MEVSYNQLKCKEIVNTTNGQRLGKMIDLIFTADCKTVLGLVVQGERKIFSKNEDIFIPWKDVIKIGEDVILVNLFISGDCNRNVDKDDDFLITD